MTSILVPLAERDREGVLPDANTAQSLGTLARKLSRCKEGMARLPSPKAGRFCSPGTNPMSCMSVAVQVLLRAGNKSRYRKFYRKQVRGPCLSRFTKLSK